MSEQRYNIVERIAAGGMAEVYRGESTGIEGFRKKVAIKRVLPKLSENSEFINMFLDEARLCAYLSHSKCVQVFDIGQGGGAHFIVMEFVDGADLKEVLTNLEEKNQILPVEVCVAIALDVCEGLSYAHRATDHAGKPLELVHRDISPQNVLMTRFGEVKLVDFGLAKASSHLTDEDEDMVKGKFGYLAPEVTLGQGADKRVDIFAAGILLWEMLCGRRLFLGSSDVETFKQVRAAEIPDPRQVRDDVSDDLMAVLMKALARDRDARYQTADEFAGDLSIVLQRINRPVNYSSIAHFVQQAADARAARNKSKDKTEGVIGDLLLDALHDFSSLDEPEEREPSRMGTPGVDAGTGAFVNPAEWGLDDLMGDDSEPEAAPAPAPAPAAAAAAPAAPAQQPAAAAPRKPPPPRRPAQKEADDAAEKLSAREKADLSEPPDSKEEGPFWRRWLG